MSLALPRHTLTDLDDDGLAELVVGGTPQWDVLDKPIPRTYGPVK